MQSVFLFGDQSEYTVADSRSRELFLTQLQFVSCVEQLLYAVAVFPLCRIKFSIDSFPAVCDLSTSRRASEWSKTVSALH